MRSSLLFALVPLILPGRVLAAAPPVDNDECVLAMMLQVSDSCVLTTADWNDATQSLPADTCGDFVSPSANDLWYFFIATSSSTIVEVQSADSNDAVLQVFSGTCASLNALACADETLFGGVESLQMATNIGETYSVRTYWWDYDTIPAGLGFSICVFNAPPSPVNDDCGSVTAEGLSVGSAITFTGTNTGADTTGDHAAGSVLFGSDPSVWHAFTTTECANVTVAYCGIDPEFEDVWNVLATGCPADSVVQAGSFDLLVCGDGNATLYFDSLAAGTYYLPVLFDVDDANGPYLIEVSASSCVVGIGEAVDGGDWNVFTDEEDLILYYQGPGVAARIDLFGVDGRMIESTAVRLATGERRALAIDGSIGAQVVLVRVSTAAMVSVWRVFVR